MYLQVGLYMKRSQNVECGSSLDMLLCKSEITHMYLKFYSAFEIKERL